MTKLRCKKCGDVITGDMWGTLISCNCKNISIDETDYYCRINGNADDFEILFCGEWVDWKDYYKIKEKQALCNKEANDERND